MANIKNYINTQVQTDDISGAQKHRNLAMSQITWVFWGVYALDSNLKSSYAAGNF